MPVGWLLSIDLPQCELDGIELRPAIANRIPARVSGHIILSGRSSWPVFPSHRSALSAIQRAVNKFPASIGGASCAILHRRRRPASLSLGLKLPFPGETTPKHVGGVGLSCSIGRVQEAQLSSRRTL